MLALGMWLGIGGYVLVYYGSQLWAGTGVSLADTVKLGTTGGG